ncbi:pimeloyl-ACP methyl ester esterase BioH [Methylomonas sp. MgM2]
MSRIHMEVYGQGKPLVLIHGWAMHSGVWRDFAQRLARHCQVICVDLPGHGRSDEIGSFTLESVRDALLQSLPFERFNLLGWSLGATAAMAMAEHAPERVYNLLVLAGNPRFLKSDDWPGVKPEILDGFVESLNADVAQTLIRFLALQVNGVAHGKQLLQTLKKAVQACPAPRSEILQAGLEILKTSDLRDFILRNHLPVKVIVGDRDTLIPLATVRRIREINPKIEVEILESAGHAPFLSHPEQLIAIIIDTL